MNMFEVGEHKETLRGIDVAPDHSFVATSCFKSGKVFILQLSLPASASSTLVKKEEVKVNGTPRCLLISGRGNSVFIGDAEGKITVFRADGSYKHPLAIKQCHKDAINSLRLIKNDTVLVSCAKDKRIKFWSIPENWMEYSF